MFSEDAINFLKKSDTNSERLNGVKFEENPIIGIISPEWYYSDSIRILHERNIDWDSIGKLLFSPSQNPFIDFVLSILYIDNNIDKKFWKYQT